MVFRLDYFIWKTSQLLNGFSMFDEEIDVMSNSPPSCVMNAKGDQLSKKKNRPKLTINTTAKPGRIHNLKLSPPSSPNIIAYDDDLCVIQTLEEYLEKRPTMPFVLAWNIIQQKVLVKDKISQKTFFAYSLINTQEKFEKELEQKGYLENDFVDIAGLIGLIDTLKSANYTQ